MANRTVICPACGFMQRVACERVLPERSGQAEWPRHCDRPMLVLGYRQSEAATQLSQPERIGWVALGGPISKGRGKKRWRPIVKEANLEDRYPAR